MSYILNKQLNAIYDDLEIVDERSQQNETDIDALETGVGSLPTITYKEQTEAERTTAGTYKASYVLGNLQDGSKLFTSFLPNKAFIAIEGEGIQVDDFKFACGNGSLMSQNFGLYVGPCRITQFHYSCMKYDTNGAESLTGIQGAENGIQAQFQLYEGGIARDAFININIADVGAASETIYQPPTGMRGNVQSGFLKDSNGDNIVDVSASSGTRNGCNILFGFSFKCISISNPDINTRHRIILRCETVNGIFSD